MKQLNTTISVICMTALILLAGCTGSSIDLTEQLEEDIPLVYPAPAEDIPLVYPAPAEDIPLVYPAPAVVDSVTDDGLVNLSLALLTTQGFEENTLISPLSIVSALAMTGNGATGTTLEEMERLFQSDMAQVNGFLSEYVDSLPDEEGYEVNVANSIWIRDSEHLTVEPSFLASADQYYDADVYTSPFDTSTMNEVNSWVNDETDGIIDQLLSEPPDAQTVLYLINALSFEGEWQKPYYDSQVGERTFYAIDGTEQQTDFLHSSEYVYLEVAGGTGFVKYYQDNSYAFVALLPQEGTSLEMMVEQLDGEQILALLAEPQRLTVETAMPKFTVEYTTLLNDPLITLGMPSAFDGDVADFTEMGQYLDANLYISQVIHKTKMTVDERGTVAGAATVVMTSETSAAPPTEVKEVVLDRPFFYMIVDCEVGFPLFMGCLTSVEGLCP